MVYHAPSLGTTGGIWVVPEFERRGMLAATVLFIPMVLASAHGCASPGPLAASLIMDRTS